MNGGARVPKESKAYKRCCMLMDWIVRKGFTYQISLPEVHNIIRFLIGADPRTLKTWTKALVSFGMLEPVSPAAFKVNLQSIPNLLNVAIEAGQKKLT